MDCWTLVTSVRQPKNRIFTLLVPSVLAVGVVAVAVVVATVLMFLLDTAIPLVSTTARLRSGSAGRSLCNNKNVSDK